MLRIPTALCDTQGLASNNLGGSGSYNCDTDSVIEQEACQYRNTYVI